MLVTKGRNNAWWENFIMLYIKFRIRMVGYFQLERKGFHELRKMLRLYLGKKRTRHTGLQYLSPKVGSFLYYISDEGRYRKTATTVK